MFQRSKWQNIAQRANNVHFFRMKLLCLTLVFWSFTVEDFAKNGAEIVNENLIVRDFDCFQLFLLRTKKLCEVLAL